MWRGWPSPPLNAFLTFCTCNPSPPFSPLPQTLYPCLFLIRNRHQKVFLSSKIQRSCQSALYATVLWCVERYRWSVYICVYACVCMCCVTYINTRAHTCTGLIVRSLADLWRRTSQGIVLNVLYFSNLGYLYLTHSLILCLMLLSFHTTGLIHHFFFKLFLFSVVSALFLSAVFFLQLWNHFYTIPFFNLFFTFF